MRSFCHKTHGHFTSGVAGLQTCLLGASTTISFLANDGGSYYKEGLSQGRFSCNKAADPNSENESDQNHYDLPLFPRREATDYIEARGITNYGSVIGYFDNGDYLTYDSLNFGPSGTTKSIEISYSKGNTGPWLQLRIDGPDGRVIGEFHPSNTGGWGNYVTTSINIEDVDGTHALTLVGKGGSGVMNIDFFKLSAFNLFIPP